MADGLCLNDKVPFKKNINININNNNNNNKLSQVNISNDNNNILLLSDSLNINKLCDNNKLNINLNNICQSNNNNKTSTITEIDATTTAAGLIKLQQPKLKSLKTAIKSQKLIKLKCNANENVKIKDKNDLNEEEEEEEEETQPPIENCLVKMDTTIKTINNISNNNKLLALKSVVVNSISEKINDCSSTSKLVSGITTQETEDLRKKRCADRYDSSESSDSGVATLSCTDSSTASSDSSDPGSPYSPSSICEDIQSTIPPSSSLSSTSSSEIALTTSATIKRGSSVGNVGGVEGAVVLEGVLGSATAIVAPQMHRQHNQQQQLQIKQSQQQNTWPWNTTIIGTNVNHSNNNNTNNNNNKLKRVTSVCSSDVIINNTNNNKRIRTSITSCNDKKLQQQQLLLKQQQQQIIDDNLLTSSNNNTCVNNVLSQKSKITGFFKSQMKPLNGLKKDHRHQLLTPQPQHHTIDLTKYGLEKYFNIKTKDIEQQIDVRTLTTTGTTTITPTLTTQTQSTIGLGVVGGGGGGIIHRKIERKTAKIAPTTRYKQQIIPKRPITIAPRIIQEPKKSLITTSGNYITSKIHSQTVQDCGLLTSSSSTITTTSGTVGTTTNDNHHHKNQSSTVLLTAIRFPQQEQQHQVSAQIQQQIQFQQLQQQQQIQLQQTQLQQQAKINQQATKIGHLYQLQMPNLVQIPNNKLYSMSNGQIQRVNHLNNNNNNNNINNNIGLNNNNNNNGQSGHFFMNGAYIKFQQIPTTTTTSTTTTINNNCNISNNNNSCNNNCNSISNNSLIDKSVLDKTTTTTITTSVPFQSKTLPTTITTTTASVPTTMHQATNINHQHQQPQQFTTQQLFMTSPGLIYNTTLPTVITTSGNSNQYNNLPQQIPALHPIQQNCNLLPSISTILPNHNNNNSGHQHQQQQQQTIISHHHHHHHTMTSQLLSNIPSSLIATTKPTMQMPLPPPPPPPPPPPLISQMKSSIIKQPSTKLLQSLIDNGQQSSSSIVNNCNQYCVTSSPPSSSSSSSSSSMLMTKEIQTKLVTLNVDTGLPTTTIIPTNIDKNVILEIDLCSPSISIQSSLSSSSLTTKESQMPCLSSPKSLILEKIQQKKPGVLTTTAALLSGSLLGTTSSLVSKTSTVTLTSSLLTSTQNLISTSPTKTPIIDTEFQSINLPESAKSPILSQPKTIRFPVNGESVGTGSRLIRKSDGRIVGMCYWDKCKANYDSSSKLLDHMQTQHVNTQNGPYSCLWAGCKVHSRESCSRRWLERHVLSHGGTKPFKCIVSDCGLRFGSQLALQKHVNSHFNNVESTSTSTKKSTDPLAPKALRKNGKKLRYRRQPWSARMFDFFDSGVMEGLQHRLLITGSIASGPDGSVQFKGQSIAKRITANGIVEILTRWNPCDIIPDEWIPETKELKTKNVAIQSMNSSERQSLQHYMKNQNKRTKSSTMNAFDLLNNKLKLPPPSSSSSMSLTTSSCSSASSSISSSSSSSFSSSSSSSSSLSSYSSSSSSSLSSLIGTTTCSTQQQIVTSSMKRHRKSRKTTMPS